MTRGGKNYHLTDALGSVVAMVDETGAKVNTAAALAVFSPYHYQRFRAPALPVTGG
ncbi:hypothetical protein [Streptomyces sp. JH34]|uniref:hypothetical protein n=1 Tax=Streptomyces sp. JH34 TaxID=2793633 RepID=UPI0023F6A076|nr:hypothetical protein [Streptomyces sp. JH34]MDF6019534.1 hypothetical protein [Streptomyces sp. JH34]